MRKWYASVTTLIARWARAQGDVVGAAVVGSWARGADRMDSDIDIVVLTTEKARYVDDDHWVATALVEPAEIIRRQDWGALTERRVRLSSGLEVEFGVPPPNADFTTRLRVPPGMGADGLAQHGQSLLPHAIGSPPAELLPDGAPRGRRGGAGSATGNRSGPGTDGVDHPRRRGASRSASPVRRSNRSRTSRYWGSVRSVA